MLTATENVKTQGRARVAGICYLVTFLSSIPALALEHSVLGHPGYVGPDGRLALGGVLDLVNAAAAVGTAVALYPTLRRRFPALALGFVTSRLVEAAAIVTSVLAILALITVHRGATAADEVALLMVGKCLVAVHDWAFLLGPGLIPAVNALLLGTILYRSRLVPRIIPIVGLVGAPLLLASATATIFGWNDQLSTASGIATLPIGAWELSLGLRLTTKGLNQSCAAASSAAVATVDNGKPNRYT